MAITAEVAERIECVFEALDDLEMCEEIKGLDNFLFNTRQSLAALREQFSSDVVMVLRKVA